MTEQNISAMEQQLAQLQESIAQARAHEGKDQSAPVERAEVHAAMGEQIQQSVPSYQPAPATPASSTDIPEELRAPVQELVNLAFSDGVDVAIRKAQASGNDALIDALHDILTDQLHDQLLARGKIAPAV